MTGKIINKIHFENEDIVITDPGYIAKDKSGCDLGLLGISKFMTSKTYYGDWSCTIWKASTLKECVARNAIGNFCADCGLVCVASWNEVIHYNSDFEGWLKEHPWCGTRIKNFTGDVKFVLTKNECLRIYGLTDKKVVWIAVQTGC